MDEHDPQAGDVWRHTGNGQEYTVMGRATDKAPGVPLAVDGLVVYRDVYQIAWYVRPVENFRARFVFVRSAQRR